MKKSKGMNKKMGDIDTLAQKHGSVSGLCDCLIYQAHF